MPLVKDLSALRSNLERRPSSRADHHHTATLPSRESSKKAHLGCHFYGITWLACSQVNMPSERYAEDSVYLQLCFLINESQKSHPLFINKSHDWCSKFVCIDSHCVALHLCGFSENRLKLEEFLAW